MLVSKVTKYSLRRVASDLAGGKRSYSMCWCVLVTPVRDRIRSLRPLPKPPEVAWSLVRREVGQEFS